MARSVVNHSTMEPSIQRAIWGTTMSKTTLSPYIGLLFDGRCEAAFRFYERCLNAKIVAGGN